MVWAIHCLCVTLPGLHWGLLPFWIGQDWYMWWLVTWPVTGHYLNHSWPIVHWNFWTNSGFTLLKPSLLWFATFKNTSLSGNHTARPLCGDPTGLVGSLHRDQQCVSLGVSLNKFYDVREVISVLLAPCAGNPQTSGFPSQMVGSGDFLLMFKLLNKQLKCHRSQNFLFSIFTLMWRHCNVDSNIVWPVYDLYSKIFRNILKVQNWKKNHCVQAGACVDL